MLTIKVSVAEKDGKVDIKRIDPIKKDIDKATENEKIVAQYVAEQINATLKSFVAQTEQIEK